VELDVELWDTLRFLHQRVRVFVEWNYPAYSVQSMRGVSSCRFRPPSSGLTNYPQETREYRTMADMTLRFEVACRTEDGFIVLVEVHVADDGTPTAAYIIRGLLP